MPRGLYSARPRVILRRSAARLLVTCSSGRGAGVTMPPHFPMILPWLQLLPLLAAGVALFRLWRAASPRQRWLRGVVAVGFLGRALGGLALCWISWAHLPIARSLQIGDGLWVFALDALAYFPLAVRGASHGLAGLIAISRS